MKFSKKEALNFYVGIIIASLVIELFESSIGEKPFDYNYAKIIIYAIFAIIYGFWKGKKEPKRVEQ